MEWTKEEIKKLRKSLKLSQTQFAQELGYKSYFPVWEWETGRRQPSELVKRVLSLFAKYKGDNDEK